MKRREFLISAATAAGLASTDRAWAAQAGNTRLARVGISSRSFAPMIAMAPGAPAASSTIDLLDLPQMIAERFGVHNLELQHGHFRSTEDAYLKDLRARVVRAKSQVIQISTEFFATTASSAGPTRVQGIDLAKMWIDHAEALGCTRVMVSAGPLGDGVRANAIEALKAVAAYARTHKVTVSIQNLDTGAALAPLPAPPQPAPAPAADAAAPATGRRGGEGGGGRGGPPAPPASWQVIAEVARASGVLVTPNLAGFPSETERAAGLRALYPLSNGNSHVSTDAGTIDLPSAIKAAREAGYKGFYTIVTDSGAADPSAAMKLAVDELTKLI